MATSTQEHYSLRWNNHQNHILRAFGALLQNETLVDVTLVCAETSVRAHKVVLSACSPFFQRIFSETPCKHPVIVLKDFKGWEVQAIVDFMYRGEISVPQERLQMLIRAGESLQVRGLVDHSVTSEPRSLTPAVSNEEFDTSPSPSLGDFDSHQPLPAKLPHMNPLNFNDIQDPFSSPLPRRKQARPRRRSGECPQDLSKSASPVPRIPTVILNKIEPEEDEDDFEPEEVAENLCIKKPITLKEVRRERHLNIPSIPRLPSSVPLTPPHSMLPKMESDDLSDQQIDLSMSHLDGSKDYAHSPPLSLPPPNMMHNDGHLRHSPLTFPSMPSVSALALTPPHHMFGLDSPLLFPHGMDPGKLYSPLLDLGDPRGHPGSEPPHHFGKKKLGRPKGQHSAPRGGPPRSWTNAELTEALQHVWNKKMTTSQASRIFGIPYNSLLMYVRGKYGKSLKLEQLRKDCISGPPLELLNMPGNNNNNKNSMKDEGMRPSSSEQDLLSSPLPFNPFPPGFYPDLGGFPLPLHMLQLMPSPGDRRDLGHPGREPFGLDLVGKDDSDMKHSDIMRDDFHDSPLALSREERRELIQQNGQD